MIFWGECLAGSSKMRIFAAEMKIVLLKMCLVMVLGWLMPMGLTAIYNLQGVRVQKAQKGLYIQNGKKFAVK